MNNSAGLQPAPRWVAPLFAILGLATIPWTFYLAVTLPERMRTHNYRLSWVGFDILLVAALLLTAHLAWRARPTVGLMAASTATLLIVDAWFDITTSGHAGVTSAILSAVLVELPLAALCIWIALHVDQVIERRLRSATRRHTRNPQTTP